MKDLTLIYLTASLIAESFAEYQRLHKKKWGTLRSFDIPHWGKDDRAKLLY